MHRKPLARLRGRLRETGQRIARRRWLRVILALALMAALASLIDVSDVLARLGHANARDIVAALLLVQCQIVVSAERWRVTAAALGQRLARGWAIREYYIASLLNQLLPGGVTGDVLRAWRSRRAGHDRAATHVPPQAILIERLAGQVVLGCVAALGTLLWLRYPAGAAGTATPVWRGLALGALSLLIGLIGLAGITAALAASLPAHSRLHTGLGWVYRFLVGLAPAIRRAWLTPDLWWRQITLSLIVVASYLAAFALASHAVGAPLGLSAVLFIVPLCLLAMVVPASIAGWGLREAAAAVLWPLAGATPAEGVAASVIYGLVCVVGAAPGLIGLWPDSGRARTAPR